MASTRKNCLTHFFFEKVFAVKIRFQKVSREPPPPVNLMHYLHCWVTINVKFQAFCENLYVCSKVTILHIYVFFSSMDGIRHKTR